MMVLLLLSKNSTIFIRRLPSQYVRIFARLPIPRKLLVAGVWELSAAALYSSTTTGREFSDLDQVGLDQRDFELRVLVCFVGFLNLCLQIVTDCLVVSHFESSLQPSIVY